ncbi:hypothetical protein BDR07DRAFT_1398761 [Suillus spraguei]|nr:hypothetical protein BDR07DRAFT_1398761 [Suillus spraguei]
MCCHDQSIVLSISFWDGDRRPMASSCNQIRTILLAYVSPRRHSKPPTAVDTVNTINHLPTSVFYHARDDHERRLVRKLDLRMSILLVLNTLNLIDRTNISNARLQGFEKDLHLHGQQYATTLSIAYVGYIIMQVPGNMFMHWLERPSIILPSCMLTWGIISVLIGITTKYTSLFCIVQILSLIV